MSKFGKNSHIWSPWKSPPFYSMHCTAIWFGHKSYAVFREMHFRKSGDPGGGGSLANESVIFFLHCKPPFWSSMWPPMCTHQHLGWTNFLKVSRSGTFTWRLLRSEFRMTSFLTKNSTTNFHKAFEIWSLRPKWNVQYGNSVSTVENKLSSSCMRLLLSQCYFLLAANWQQNGWKCHIYNPNFKWFVKVGRWIFGQKKGHS